MNRAPDVTRAPDAARAPRLSEAQIQQQILLALGGRHDCRVWRNNVGAARTQDGRVVRFGTKGQADILGVLRLPTGTGLFVAIEVKSARGRLRPEQRAWGAMVQAMGGLYIVARSVEDAVHAVDACIAAALNNEVHP